MALRSLHESYVLPKSKLDDFDYEDSARRLREAMKGFKSRQLRDNPELQREVGIIFKD